jgi:glycosyltransferase involved in cell wall biosynthesis
MNPKVLKVETGFSSLKQIRDGWWADILDYEIYRTIPHWWRRIEEKLRLDIMLGWYAKKISDQYDIIWADSEKVGIVLSFVGLRKPLIVVAHHLESPKKALLARITGIAKKWAGIGYISNEGKQFFMNDLGVPASRLFQCESAKYLKKITVNEDGRCGPIMSAGVAKRDYNTLISALADLEGYETELFVSSKFGDELAKHISSPIPSWVRIVGFLPESELIRRYQEARFIVIPLEKTTHNGAGINVVLEAGAFCKAVIATNTGGMPTFVREGETGILVPPYDVESMRKAIRKLWNEPDLAHQMGLAGRRYVESEFNPKVVDERIREFLIRVYKEPRFQ